MHFNNLASAAISLVAFAAPSDAFWRMSCPGRIMTSRMDPIVNPGAVSGHVHTISGGNAFNFTMTYNDTQKSDCSSCPIKQDLSNYWTPNLYYRTKDGQFINVPQAGDGTGVYGGMTVYYLQRGGPNNDALKAFPKDFRMLAGNPYKRNYTDDFAGQAVSYVCLDYSGTSNYYNKFPDKPCPDGLRAQIFFPSCWDGVNTDSADHKSHMAYPTQYSYDNGPCPASHPVHTISIFYEVIYSTAGFDWWTPDNNWQPFVWSMGDPTGYGYHGDFLNGWDVPTLQAATDQCNAQSGDPHDCPVFNFFDDATSQGCLVAPSISQPVTGTLAKLPGCNPVQDTNAVSQSGCGDNATIGAQATYYTNQTSWDYLGCGTDQTANRTFSADSWWDNSVTVQSCMNYCGNKGYKYVGLEYGTQCFCSNTLAADRAPVSGILGNCFTPCAGNSSQYCGGASRLSIYKMNTATFTPIDTGASSVIKCPSSNGTTYASANGTFTVECGMDRGGGDIGMKGAANITACMDTCAATAGCTFVSLSGSACYMKGGALRPASLNSGVTGAYISKPLNTTASSAASSSTASVSTTTSTSKTTTAVTTTTAVPTTTTAAAATSAAAASSSPVALIASSATTAQAAAATSTLAPTCPGSNSTYYQSSTGAIFLVECGIDHSGGDMGMQGVQNLQQCLDLCASTTGCVDVSLSGTACYMKKTLGTATFGNSGLKGGKLVGSAAAASSSATTAVAATSATTVAPAASSSTTTAPAPVVSSSTTTVAPAPTTTTTAAAQPTTTSAAAAIAVVTTSKTTTTTTTSAAPAGTQTVTAASCPTNNGTIYVDPSSGNQYLIECGIDHQGGDMGMTYTSTLEGCIAACSATTGCVDVSLSGNACYMKKTVGKAVSGGVKGAKLITTAGAAAATGGR